MGKAQCTEEGTHVRVDSTTETLDRIWFLADSLLSADGQLSDGIAERIVRIRARFDEILEKCYALDSSSADPDKEESAPMLVQIGTYYVKGGHVLRGEGHPLVIRPCLERPSDKEIDQYLRSIGTDIEQGVPLVDGTGQLVSIDRLADKDLDRLCEIFYSRSDGKIVVLPRE